MRNHPDSPEPAAAAPAAAPATAGYAQPDEPAMVDTDMKVHRPGVKLGVDATRQFYGEISEMIAVVQHLDWGVVSGEFFENEEIALACYASLYRRTPSMVILPNGSELKYFGLRFGRDLEMKEWWLYHTGQADAAPKLKEACLNRSEVETRSTQALVVANIYDVSAHAAVKGVNKVLRLVGTGAYHAAVEVYGREVSFGGFPPDYDYPEDSGLFFCDPRGCEAHSYRESIYLGRTSLSNRDVSILFDNLALEWPGGAYDLLEKNCCHFSDDLCKRLGTRGLPPWITTLAGAGTSVVGVIQEGRDAREADEEDGYKFGDFARGLFKKLLRTPLSQSIARGSQSFSSARQSDSQPPASQ
jgi:hypothetical protein